MLPKIIVADIVDRDDFLTLINVDKKKMVGYEGSEAKVDDLRGWIFTAISNVKRNPKLNILIWDADEMSNECQAILLKPLEEVGDEEKIFLVARSEHKMLSTILSRCVVLHFEDNFIANTSYWNEVRKCLASGPAACIAFSDTLDKDQAKMMINEVIIKMKNSLEVEINNSRLQVINNALECLADLKGTNINLKLTVDIFLIGAWKLTKT